MDKNSQQFIKTGSQQQQKASLTKSYQQQLDYKQKIESFIQKHNKNLSKQFKSHENPHQVLKIKILQPEQIEKAASQIKANRLVAFPTETVFGLGANALNQKALLDIYKTKRRPLTDPIIVHVLNFQDAKKLIHVTEAQQKLALVLADKFWPGPLTIIFKANLEVLPSVVTAQTGYVGIRAPKHPFARALIKQSGLPIGAPSANLFAHVSPTSAVHVFNDFYNQDITLIDGDRCEFGIESTVTKIVEDEITKKIKIFVLREGSLSVDRLRKYVEQVYSNMNLEVPQVILSKKVKSENENMQAPGQLLKHYSPYLPCFTCSDYQELLKEKKLPYQLSNIALMSFSKQFSGLKDKVKYYFEMDSINPIQQNQKDFPAELVQQNIFCSHQEQIAMKNLYYMLRHCENLDCEAIVIGWTRDKSGTIWDKVFRATQGKQLEKAQH